MNKAILMGRLTRDPELRYTNTNTVPVCSFTLAVNRRFTKQGEERQADFINMIAWGKTAEFCKNYFRKGSQIAVVGRIQTGKYEKDGRTVYTTEVIVEDAFFADSKRGNEDQSNEANAGSSDNQTEAEGFINVDDDDNLPF
ncbi:MAG: single-stranded DNA-binding protein [Clostridia bacterium]